MGYPGGKSKIIHKDSDAIMAFAINKVRNQVPFNPKTKFTNGIITS